MNLAKVLIPATKPVANEPRQGATPANGDNVFANGRQPTSMTEEPIVFMAKSEVKAMLRREKEKAFVSSICLDLKPPLATEVATNLYQLGYISPQFHKFYGR